MKKIIPIGFITLLAGITYANNFVVIISENDNYAFGEYTESISYSQWVENVECSYDVLNDSVYYDVEFEQTETCITTNTRIKTIVRNYEDGNSLTTTENEETSETDTSVSNVYGTHLENSCSDILSFNNSFEDGVYSLSLNDSSIKEMYCDMTNGGWTLVSHIYDRDYRDDILDNSNGAGWGDTANDPTSDTAFNLDNSLTPTYTDSKWEWIYPNYNETYEHSVNDTVLIDTRFAWVNPDWSSVYLNWHLENDLNILNEYGYKYGVFGVHSIEYPHSEYLGILDEDHSCGASILNNHKALHYWGYGNLIAFGNDSTYELHNLKDGYDRSLGSLDNTTGCGTRNAIFNIWIK